MENIITVKIWNRTVGKLMWNERQKTSVFEYDRDFLKGNLDIAPLSASIHDYRYQRPFRGEPQNGIFQGLPPFISDSLPGKWGNTVFSAWAEANGIRESQITPVDKLSFIGKRAMGALEFEPEKTFRSTNRRIELEELYKKAEEILSDREHASIEGKDLTLESLYEVGTSAGGQHTKAVIAISDKTGEIRSGQILLPEEYRYYLLKFCEKQYYPLTRVEMVYGDLAKKAGIDMMPCCLVEIGGDAHFLTERFDRINGEKTHVLSLAAMNPEASCYEDLIDVCLRLKLSSDEISQTYRRIIFNILTANVDAHIKNFSFTLKEGKEWHISPAYDLTFSCFNPGCRFDETHALRLEGKHKGINNDDLIRFGDKFNIRNPKEIIGETAEAVRQFRDTAGKYGVEPYWIDKIEGHLAEMNPETLNSLSQYKATNVTRNENGIETAEAHWTEMGNGAMRLTATVNGTPLKMTFAPNSATTKEIWKKGGTKMKENDIMEYVRKFLYSRINIKTKTDSQKTKKANKQHKRRKGLSI